MKPNDGLTIFDVVILVASIAAGLAVTRGLPDYQGIYRQFGMTVEFLGGGSSGIGLETPGRFFKPLAGRPLHHRPSFWLGHVPYWAGPPLFFMTVASAALEFRSPGPRRRLLARRPGLVAGLAVIAAAFAVAIHGLQYLIAIGRPWNQLKPHLPPCSGYFWTSLPVFAGYTVAVLWLSLVLSGSWSSDPGSRARLGRALGWSWVAMAASSEVGVWLYLLNS
ncbi:hypothetical protein [Paludisphaera soli]|uniref:hypothetical protein n=1 Tax=Paludisphaera soli TaxID=2712865 RepID=UPI0013EC5B94|nr:hypothetical protein [Paludisphaera soli]